MVKQAKVKQTDEKYGGPKKARSGYFIYGDEVRAKLVEKLKAEAAEKNEKFSITDVGRQTSEMWKTVSEEEKKKYSDTAASEKETYEKAMEVWKASEGYKLYQKDMADALKKKKGDEAKAKAMAGDMPKKPTSGYMMFSGSIASDIIETLKKEGKPIDMKHRSGGIKTRWDGLGVEGQKEWNDKATAAKEKYNTEYAAWKETDAGKEYLKSMESAAKDAKAKKDKVDGKEPSKRKKAAEKGDGPAPKKRKVQNAESAEPQAEESPVGADDDAAEEEGQPEEEGGEEEAAAEEAPAAEVAAAA